MNPQRIGALTGVLFVILVIAAFIVSGETPSTDDSPGEIVKYYLNNDDEQMISAGLLGWASVALLFFLGSLRRILRQATGDDGGLSTIVTLGGAFIAVGATVFAGLTFALGDAADDMPVAAVVALNALNSDMFMTLAVGVATFNIGLGLAILRHGVFAKPLGILAIIVGIVGVTPLGFFAFLVTGIVIIWLSVAMMMKDDTPGGSPALGVPSAL